MASLQIMNGPNSDIKLSSILPELKRAIMKIDDDIFADDFDGGIEVDFSVHFRDRVKSTLVKFGWEKARVDDVVDEVCDLDSGVDIGQL